ncbi:MAG: VOC family protein [Thermoleophilia bacterium]
MPRPVHFDISVDDPEAAISFYEKTFGWKFEKWEGPMDYWLITTGGDDEAGINGGLARREEQSLPGTVNTLEVKSLDEMIEKVEAAGGRIVAPRMAVPGVGWLAYFADPGGNVFGMMESDEGAA